MECYIHDLVHYRNRVYVSGWAFHPSSEVKSLEYRLADGEPVLLQDWKRPSPDLELAHGPAAAKCRFDFEFIEVDPNLVCDLRLIFTLEDGARLELSDLAHEALSQDPYHQLLARYFKQLSQMDGISVLEIGSRDRSGYIRRGQVHPGARYVGFDVIAGDNVDVVGDAHDLGTVFDHDQFDMVFTISTFEHLAMPWKVAAEINRVMKVGGLLLVSTHQTWPLHEEPWDFWRFSEHSWPALFNAYTGFEIVEVASGEPASIVAHVLHPPLESLPYAKACLASAVVCRKVAEPKVDWDVPLSEILATTYPTVE